MTADLIAARRQHIMDSAPCVGCGATLAYCNANRGKDPAAPPWFGCCARGMYMAPCQHTPDPGALLELLAEIEAGTVRTVEEATPKPREQGMSWSDYVDQGERWKPNEARAVAEQELAEVEAKIDGLRYEWPLVPFQELPV